MWQWKILHFYLIVPFIFFRPLLNILISHHLRLWIVPIEVLIPICSMYIYLQNWVILFG